MASSQAFQSHTRIMAGASTRLTDRKNRPNLDRCTSRRKAVAAALATTFLGMELVIRQESALSFQLEFTAPDQTPEEANAKIKFHVHALLQVKSLIELQSWRQVQTELRESSSYLKQDLYTLIQAQPGNQRPQLRKLYSDLFNNVTRLDYAARSKNANLVEECYQNITTVLENILAKLYS